MIEARVFVDSLQPARQVLSEMGARSMGEYEITDEIYRRRDRSVDIDKDFLRLRSIPLNIWHEGPFVLAIKKTKLQAVGKAADVPIKQEFSKYRDMVDWHTAHTASEYEFDFQFHRTGEQFELAGGDQVDLEVNEAWPTVELKSQTSEGLKKLLKQFAIRTEQLVVGPSVVEMRRLLGS